MKKKSVVFVLILLVAAGGWFAWGYLGAGGASGAAQTSGKKGSSSATLAEVTIGDMESLVTAQGTIEPRDSVDVGAQVSGLIKKLHVEIGDTVKEGDLVAEIDPDVYETQVRADQARLKTLEAQKAEQESLVRQAESKFNRNKALVSAKAVSKETFEDSQFSLDVARANLAALEAQIEESQSSLEGDQVNLGYTKIYAPMDGTVVDQSVEEGQTINANQTAPVIVTVAKLDVMTVRAQVAEADIMKLGVDMPAYFTTLGSDTRRWEGKIRQILPTPETVNDVVLYNVLVDVENKDRSLMSGMTTQTFFVLGRAKDAMIIPVGGLGKRLESGDSAAGKAYEVRVALDEKGEQLETRTVHVILSDRTHAAISDGIKTGDRVLVKGASSGESSSSSSGQGRMTPPGMARL